jgi:MFS family permease
VRLWLLAQVAALALALPHHGAALALSAALSGFAGVGISAVTLAWAREEAGERAGPLWVRATICYALAQALAALALAALFAATSESHAAVFLAAASPPSRGWRSPAAEKRQLCGDGAVRLQHLAGQVEAAADQHPAGPRFGAQAGPARPPRPGRAGPRRRWPR